MKTIRLDQYGGPEELHYEDVSIPQPSEGQLLVRVQAASINPIDYKLASGAFRHMMPLHFPWIPGDDFAGVVEAVGPGVTSQKPGDTVYGDSPGGGPYAEFVVASAGMVAPMPAKLSPIEAASVPVAAQTAWQGLFEHGRLERGQTVLIHAAAGGVGSFAVQLARWKGARVLATSSAKNADYLQSLGADQVIDYRATPFESVATGMDLILDLLGGETQQRSFSVLKLGGRLVSTVQPPSEDEAVRRKLHATMMVMKPSAEGLKQLARLVDAGTIRTVVTKTYPLSQAQDAWKYQMSGHTRGKVVLEIQG
ncbi:MAG TPA: NADP-dependent oxidoreductase [Planctomycetaceae bacterium]|jgi:NADPH:quinone reductase-like Zn-dependent oxidoreductase|nr:NADP-dependent oxidoreductase [Planctomycetaceae bacterium]